MDDIKELFERIADRFADADEGSRGMFAMLVRVALEYRDKLMHSSGVPLTVGETKAALDIFMEVLKTQRLPECKDEHVKELVMLWLTELKKIVHN